MNKYIIILIILLLILIYTYFIKNNNEHYSAESLIDIFSPCKEVINGTVIFNNANINGDIKLGGTQPKQIRQYILDVLFPYGSFYVQYPNKNSNNDSEAFPAEKSPSRLFGGDWQEQWPEESIFFRTNGYNAKENRINGYQSDALRTFINLDTDSNIPHLKPVFEGNGIFQSLDKTSPFSYSYNCGRLRGLASIPVTKYFTVFDSMNQSNTSELETRVKNRQIKVWKRVKRENNGSMPSLPKNGRDSQYDNIYFEGPQNNNTFVSPKDFNYFDKINTVDKAFIKCKEMGDECNAIGVSKNGVFKYSDTVDVNLISDRSEIGNSYSIWFKKKDIAVL